MALLCPLFTTTEVCLFSVLSSHPANTRDGQLWDRSMCHCLSKASTLLPALLHSFFTGDLYCLSTWRISFRVDQVNNNTHPFSMPCSSSAHIDHSRALFFSPVTDLFIYLFIRHSKLPVIVCASTNGKDIRIFKVYRSLPYYVFPNCSLMEFFFECLGSNDREVRRLRC